MRYSKLLYLLIICFSIFSKCTETYAQQVIINVPNADILDKGQLYGRLPIRFRPFYSDKYAILNTVLIIGTGGRTEVESGIANINFVESHIQPYYRTGIKKGFYLTKSTNTRVTVGSRLEVNLAESETPFTFTFCHLSQRFEFMNTRLTAGTYISNTPFNNEFIPNKVGAILGIEGTIVQDKLLYSIDWISRNEPYGVIGAGVKYLPNKSTILIPGVLIPNGNRSRFGFIFAISKYFN